MSEQPLLSRAGPAMLLATLCFAVMGVFVKKAAESYGVGEILFYRSLLALGLSAVVARSAQGTLRTNAPTGHFAQALGMTVTLALYFFSMSKLPLATAITLNYLSSIWLTALVAVGISMRGGRAVSIPVMGAIAAGFGGVVLVLHPTFEVGQAWGAGAGLLSGLLAAVVYLQGASLVRSGEPIYRVVFYCALGSLAGSACLATATGWHPLTLVGAAKLLAVGVFGAAGQALLARAYAGEDQIVAASLQYVGIAYALVLGIIFLGDVPDGWSLGGICVIVGAALVCVRLRSRQGASA